MYCFGRRSSNSALTASSSERLLISWMVSSVTSGRRWVWTHRLRMPMVRSGVSSYNLRATHAALFGFGRRPGNLCCRLWRISGFGDASFADLSVCPVFCAGIVRPLFSFTVFGLTSFGREIDVFGCEVEVQGGCGSTLYLFIETSGVLIFLLSRAVITAERRENPPCLARLAALRVLLFLLWSYRGPGRGY